MVTKGHTDLPEKCRPKPMMACQQCQEEIRVLALRVHEALEDAGPNFPPGA